MPSKVLIVDDDKPTRVGLKDLLEHAGYQAISIGTFEEALRFIRATPPDLLIVDIRLGPFNGLQLLISSPKPLPAIVITGFADRVLEFETRKRGAEFVLKPFDPAKMLELVHHKLSSRQGFGVPRRWERKQVIGGLPATVAEEPARILDVSYGGVCFELERVSDQTLPRAFDIMLPTADLSLKAELVWKSAVGSQLWLCGAALANENPSALQWYGLVDELA